MTLFTSESSEFTRLLCFLRFWKQQPGFGVLWNNWCDAKLVWGLWGSFSEFQHQMSNGRTRSPTSQPPPLPTASLTRKPLSAKIDLMQSHSCSKWFEWIRSLRQETEHEAALRSVISWRVSNSRRQKRRGTKGPVRRIGQSRRTKGGPSGCNYPPRDPAVAYSSYLRSAAGPEHE